MWSGRFKSQNIQNILFFTNELYNNCYLCSQIMATVHITFTGKELMSCQSLCWILLYFDTIKHFQTNRIEVQKSEVVALIMAPHHIFLILYEHCVWFFFSYPPWFDDNAFRIYEKIIEGRLEWPKHLDPVAK